MSRPFSFEQTMDLWRVIVLLLTCTLLPATAPPLINPENVKVDLKRSLDEKCLLCIETVKIIQDALQSSRTLDDVFPLVEKLCVDLMKDYSSAAYMCPGIIYSYGPVVQYVFTERILDPRTVCEQFHLCNQLLSNGMPREELLKHVVNQKQFSTERNYEANGIRSAGMTSKLLRDVDKNSEFLPKSRKQHSGQITFVQISDIHLDHEYTEGSSVDCGLYLCCRKWYNGTGARAGHYGSHHCDLPIVTLDLLLDTLRDLHPKPDFMIYTGDNPPHDIWNETFTSQLNATNYVVNYVTSKLPNVTIYPAFGNHETWPESEYMGTLPQYEHLTKALSDYWQKWVHFPQESLDTIAKGGYYSVKVLNNLRLISFNSNYGYGANFFTFLNDENDHYWTQWRWMIDELSLSKENGEKVLIIAHIPPGDSDNLAEYGEFYLNMTKQFSDTIVGHLFGHTHRDQFQLIQDEDGVYGVALVSPSVTPYPTVNPSFRLFTMDANSLKLTGYQQYHLNLTMANEMYQNGSQIKPRFELSYSTAEEYDLSDLSPPSWANLVERFYQFPSLTEQYHYNIRGKSSAFDKKCDQECRKDTLCSVSNIVSTNYFKCIADST